MEERSFLHIKTAFDAKYEARMWGKRWEKETWTKFNARLQEIGVYYDKAKGQFVDITTP